MIKRNSDNTNKPDPDQPRRVIDPEALISRFINLPDTVKPFIPDFEFVFVDLSAYSNDLIKKKHI
jgi:hypothetical protein